MNETTINGLRQEVWQWVESVGWHNKTPLEYVALIAEEIGELARAVRLGARTINLGDNDTAVVIKPKYNINEEMADIILRILDFSKVMGIDIEVAISEKMIKNYNSGTRGRPR